MSELSALKSALAAEQAVVYGYGVVGAHTKGARRKAAASRITAHQTVRDRIAAMITAAGATPVPAEPAYQLPFAVTDEASAAQLGAHLEDGAAGAAWDLAAAARAQSPARQLAVDWLSNVAVASSRWQPQSAALPGRPG